MNRMFLGAAVLLLAVLARADADVFYSPVFNMPLQPAPSPSNGGYYWVLPDGRLWGPNYYLVPPFTPITGFNSAAAGQEVFAKVFAKYLKAGPDAERGHKHHAKNPAAQPNPQGNPQGNPKNVGLGPYTQDYSDPRTIHTFDQQQSSGPGYPTFPAPQPPRTSGYPPYAYQYRQTGYPVPGYHLPSYPNMIAQAPAVAYRPNYYYQPMANGQVVRAQAQVEMGPPPTPQGYGGSAPTYLPTPPSFPANSYLPNMPVLPNQNPALNCPPMAPQTFPRLPSPYYVPQSPQFPPLPTPHFAPEPSFDGCGQPGYMHPAAIRSPRDFFMWGDVKDDERQRERKALQVP